MVRAESLLAKGTFTQLDLEQASLDLANAESDVVSGQVSVENARIAVDDTDVRAPILGTVIQKPVEKGQVISSPTRDVSGGSLLLQMADLSEVQIRALIDETDIGKIRPGMAATVEVAAYPNQPFRGSVIKIEPQAVVEQNVTMFAVLVSIDNRDGLLMPGMNAEVDVLISRSEDVVSIPIGALRTNRDIVTTAGILGITEAELRGMLEPPGGDRAVASPKGRPRGEERGTTDYRFGGNFWVVMDGDGQATVRDVRTGITDLDHVEIVEGLEESESVQILPSSHLVETQQDLQEIINRRVGVPGIKRQ
jgi:HlyD family secretion protein